MKHVSIAARHHTVLARAIEEASHALAASGWCVIPNAMPAAAINAIDTDLAPAFARTPFCQGAFYGETTKRFGRLFARSERTAALALHPLIQGTAEAILASWCDCIQLNVTQAIAVHPGAPAQAPHRDQDMWNLPPGGQECLVNVIWPLTRFTADNGATRVWPGSHAKAALKPEPASDPVAVEIEPGSALLLLGSTLHAAGANRSSEVRRALVIGYSLGWLKPYENPFLAYPPEVARSFAPELAALVGYRQHRPNLGNFEGQCPSIVLRGDGDRPIAAIDALRPDQIAMVEAHRDEQRRSP